VCSGGCPRWFCWPWPILGGRLASCGEGCYSLPPGTRGEPNDSSSLPPCCPEGKPQLAGVVPYSFGDGPPKKATGFPGQRRISPPQSLTYSKSQSPKVLFPQLSQVLQTAPPPASSLQPALLETLPPAVAPCLAGLSAQVFEGRPRSASEESRCTMDLPWFPVFVPAAGGLPEGDPLPPSTGLGGGAGSAPGTDTSLPNFCLSSPSSHLASLLSLFAYTLTHFNIIRTVDATHVKIFIYFIFILLLLPPL
jgi:hypothetical protein